MYKAQEHPTFKGTFAKAIVIGVFAGFAFMFLTIFLSNSGFGVLAGIFALLFVSSILAVLVGSIICLKKPKCPTCSNICESTKDESRGEWLGVCHTCKVTWKLGVGSKPHGSNIL